jgi:hypothetical protein
MNLNAVMREIVQAYPDEGFTWDTFTAQYPTVRDQHRQLLLVCLHSLYHQRSELL